ncbi:MAG: transglutaminase-like domain-containing protein [Acetivibrionales bacterium]|jgi:transglutaminase-like putative cysteine protease
MRKARLTVLLMVVFLLFSVCSYAAADQYNNFDNSRSELGTVGARYVPSAQKRVKTRVQNNMDKYDYDLFGRDNFEYFPLQLGDGEYKISIFENITGNRYRQVKAQNIKAAIKNILDVFRASIQTVNWNPDMEIIKKAGELTKDLMTDKEKIVTIYNFVVDTFSYDYNKINNINTTYVPDIEQIYIDKKGICYDYSAVFAAMLRSQNIPSKLIKGYSDLVDGYHAWNEVYLADENRWIVIDTTYDSVLKKSNKKFNMEKDREKFKASRQY